ncbi:MAG: beta-ketoacyl-ACP synthase III [Actinomycetota bacterium]
MTSVLKGLGAAVPSRIVTNDELAETLDTSDEWVRTRTGIAERRIAEPGVATADLAVEASAEALKHAEVGIDAVVVATCTADRTIPGIGPEVASRLGLGPITALDVNAACAGFVYALSVASGLIASGVADGVLVTGAETMSRVTDFGDRSTAVLFGDGAGAVVLARGEPGAPGEVGPFDLGSDGDGADLLEVPGGGSRRPLDAAALAEGAQYLKMDGREVYRQAVRRMVASSEAVLAKAGLSATDVDRLVGHQANARILEAVASRLGIGEERRFLNVARYGNTSAASIPLALADADLVAGERVLLTAFGAGMSWGSTLLRWPDLSVA